MATIRSVVSLARALAAAAQSEPRPRPTVPDAFGTLVTHIELRYAAEKLFHDRYFAKAVEEGEKALIAYVREKSNRPDLDGTSMMNTVFSKDRPILRVNGGQSKWEKDEQEGYMHHFAGSVLMARNPRSHNHRLMDTEEKALAVLCFINHLFEVVDLAALAP